MPRHGLVAMLVALSGTAAAADAEYVTEGRRLMCTTSDGLKEAERAISAGDKRWFDGIKECIQSRPGLKAEIIQQGVLVARVRVWDEDGKPTDYYTAPTNLKEVRR